MTIHTLLNCNANNTKEYIQKNSVDLIVTSPPYPMVEMWDKCFIQQKPSIQKALDNQNYQKAFHLMHDILIPIWTDIDRILKPNGTVCVNIGDATRNCQGQFQLFSNHTTIINTFLLMGYTLLPDIHWHKPTNIPNKFMGSGMYPPNAYVTYEHEYILVFRKGQKREFARQEQENRHKSAYFWEERNIWFSDLWEIIGTKQNISSAQRTRSGAFPLEIAYRLINMYSVKNDTVYDPFTGTGTTIFAAMATERNSIGSEIDPILYQNTNSSLLRKQNELNVYIKNRIKKHQEFIDNLPENKKDKLYQNENHSFKVKTRQETKIEIRQIHNTKRENQNTVTCTYQKLENI